MQKKVFQIVAVFFVFFFLLGIANIYGAEDDFSNAPKKNNGTKWRVGFYEGGPYQNYPMVLKAIVNGLIELDWVEAIQFPEQKDPDDSRMLWEWLADNAKSDYIKFVKDAYWSGNWEDEVRKARRTDCLQRLNQKKDIHLMLAAGTWAGQDLANDEHKTPTIVFSSSDPVGSKIVASQEDSGFDHVIARCDPTRYERQIRLFHDIIGFKRLGVAYEDTEAGKSYAALTDIQKIAEERGFQIVQCFTKDDVPDIKEAEKSVIDCYSELAEQTDAIYITQQRGVNKKNMPHLLQPINAKKLPTFSQAGSEEVKFGVLLSIAQAEFKYAGKFHAKNMAKIFNGAKPRSLSQVFEDPPKIAINLATSQHIGYDPPVDILGAADEIYQDIATAE